MQIQITINVRSDSFTLSLHLLTLTCCNMMNSLFVLHSVLIELPFCPEFPSFSFQFQSWLLLTLVLYMVFVPEVIISMIHFHPVVAFITFLRQQTVKKLSENHLTAENLPTRHNQML